MRNSLHLLGHAALAVLALGGCGLQDVKRQADAAADATRIEGRVSTDHEGVVRVLLSRARPQGGDVLINVAELRGDSDYAFGVLAGTYFISAYVDENGDGAYQAGEPASVHGEAGVPEAVVLAPGNRVTVPTLRISGPLRGVEALFSESDIALATRNVGARASLSEPIFSRESANMGMWRPIDYLERFGGGLFFLEEYDPSRTPVLFIHGINGTALDFEPVFEVLDDERFQPWVLQYSSGLEIDLISNYLLRALGSLHERHAFDDLLVVAHSMGGLVARSFVQKYAREPRAWDIPLAVTVASPLLGMPSAGSGVIYSPVVVPVWRDLAPDSDFLAALHATRWPADIPYRLVFAYLPGEGGDGVVPLERQLSAALQDEAVGVRGIEASHVGVLSDPGFLEHLAAWLEAADDAP